MTRQEQFKAEMAAIFAKYNVEMNVEEIGDFKSYPYAIEFWSPAEFSRETGEIVADEIEFRVRTRAVEHTDFQ